MKNRIFNIIQSFSEKELQQFHLFLNSPFFNRSEKIKKLFSEIKKYYPELNDVDLTYENLHQAVSPDLKYNEITMRRLLFDMEKLALNYLKYSALQEDEAAANILLRTKLEQKSLTFHYIENIKKTEALISEGVFDEKYFLNKLELETDKYNFSYINKKITGRKDIDSLILNLISGSNYLFLYYMMKVVKHYLNLKMLEESYKDIEQERSLAQFLFSFFRNLDTSYLKEFLKDETKDYYPIFEIYHNMFLTFYKADKKNYAKFKNILLKNLHDFSFNEKNFLFGSLTDFCSFNIKYQIEKDKYTKELLTLYDVMLSKKYYVSDSNRYLPDSLYRSILRFSLDASKFKWGEKFIKIYTNRLHPSNIQDMQNHSYARLYIAKQNYAQALSYLYKTNYSSFYIKLDVKNLTIIAHYELGNYDMLRAEIASYKTFLKNSRVLSKENKFRYKNFIFFIEKYVKFINNRNKTYADLLKAKIEVENNIAHKNWLLQKADQLVISHKKSA